MPQPLGFLTTTRPFIIAGALIHFRRMTALVPGRTRLRRYIVADSASDEDELNSRLETLAVADSPPTRPPASARRGGLDGDAWARVARRDATAALDLASDDEDGWLATSDEEGQGASAGESASNSDSIWTSPKPPRPKRRRRRADPPRPHEFASRGRRSPPARKPPGRMADPPNLSVATPRHVARAARRRARSSARPRRLRRRRRRGAPRRGGRMLLVQRLRTTSGITRMTKRRVGPVAAWERRAVVELSTHVCDSEEKMRHTLAHELCHAAAWVVDGVSKPPHGRAFKRWASRFMDAVPALTITTRHTYVISYKFNWRCSASGCNYAIGRHSDSLDTTKYVCGRCAAPLVAVPQPT